MCDAVDICETLSPLRKKKTDKKRKEERKAVVGRQEELSDLAVALIPLIGPSCLQLLVVSRPAPPSPK